MMNKNSLLALILFSLVSVSCLRVQGLTSHPAENEHFLLENGAGTITNSTGTQLQPMNTPSPDLPHPLPTIRTVQLTYIVQYGDTLAAIAAAHGIGINVLIEANQPIDGENLEVGRELVIPAPSSLATGPEMKIIPDSELIYGPASAGFDFSSLIQLAGGYLSQYSEILDGKEYHGDEIVLRVSRENSVNPRILLAVLEYTSSWLTSRSPRQETLDFPLRYYDPNYKGLYQQLSFAANELNRGYYLHKINALSYWVLPDGSIVPLAAGVNAGTVAVQNLFAYLFGYSSWLMAVGDEGVLSTYRAIFGNPFDFTLEPTLPPDLAQPPMQLPFEDTAVWSFTSGPHGGWGDGSAWAALDFAPPGNAFGCVTSEEWVVASADGIITYSDNGLVIQDLDGDGWEQTGWSLMYMHVESRDRVAVGSELSAGERIGHPSCEGGFSNGTHVHIARRFNGEWIAADGPWPFDLDGWISQGNGIEYDGYLMRNGERVEAWDARLPENQIQR